MYFIFNICLIFLFIKKNQLIPFIDFIKDQENNLKTEGLKTKKILVGNKIGNLFLFFFSNFK